MLKRTREKSIKRRKYFLNISVLTGNGEHCCVYWAEIRTQVRLHGEGGGEG